MHSWWIVIHGLIAVAPLKLAGLPARAGPVRGVIHGLIAVAPLKRDADRRCRHRDLVTHGLTAVALLKPPRWPASGAGSRHPRPARRGPIEAGRCRVSPPRRRDVTHGLTAVAPLESRSSR